MPLLPPLVSPGELRDVLGDERVRVFDTTVFLRRPVGGGPYTVESGRESYARAHIPGAGFADIPGVLSDPASPFAFTLPAAEHFASAAGRLGIGGGTHVIAYAQDTPMWATRLWWLPASGRAPRRDPPPAARPRSGTRAGWRAFRQFDNRLLARTGACTPKLEGPRLGR